MHAGGREWDFIVESERDPFVEELAQLIHEKMLVKPWDDDGAFSDCAREGARDTAWAAIRRLREKGMLNGA
jgi:chromosome condensin MukBEF MukE localization factor